MSAFQLNQDLAESTMRDVLLSIVTVARNDHRRLVATIRSLEHFYDDDRFEHIVIDGNSTDETQQFLQENSRRTNFKCLSEPDSGIYDAMNKGSHLAAGRFLLFLNCGDRMLASPEHVDSWLRPLTLENKADIVCFCSRVQLGTNTTTLMPQLAWPYRMPTSHQAMVFAEDFMRAHAYDTRYRIAADFNLYLKADTTRVILFSGVEPLTAIEAVGIASANPMQSYTEYLRAAAQNLGGAVKWQALARIWFKAVVVILLKKALPENWVAALRRNI